MLSKYQQGQSLLQRERQKVKDALLDSGKLAEVSMQYSGEQEERLLKKVQQNVEDCSVEEVHWLMTKTFRSWRAAASMSRPPGATGPRAVRRHLPATRGARLVFAPAGWRRATPSATRSATRSRWSSSGSRGSRTPRSRS